MDAPNPFRGLLPGRLATYLDEAYAEYGQGRIRGAYDYGMLALNSTLWELRAKGSGLFDRLRALEADGRTGPEVLAWARESPFLRKHDPEIRDMDLSYMTVDDLRDFLGFLERFYRSLAERGVGLAGDPRG